MKKITIIILFCLIPLSLLSKSVNVVVGQLISGSVNNTVDMSRGFESDSDPSGWTETDTGSKLNRYDNTTAASGTYAMSVTVDEDSVKAYQEYNIGSDKTTASVSFWFYAVESTAGNFTQVRPVFMPTASSGGGGNQVIATDFYKSGTTYALRIVGTTTASITISTMPAWYRLEYSLTKNGNCSLSVYDSDGTQVGTTQTVTGKDKNIQYLIFGMYGASQSTDRYVQRIDAIGVDWTDATTPLYPFTVKN